MATATWHVQGENPDGAHVYLTLAVTPDRRISVLAPGAAQPVLFTPKRTQRLRHCLGLAMGTALQGVRW